MSLEPDNRPEVEESKKIDWDNLDATYEAPGARDAVPDMPPIPEVTTPPPKNNWAWQHYDDGYHAPNEEWPPPPPRSHECCQRR